MLKLAFKSYLSAIHPRNIKKITFNNSFWIIYWAFIYPLIISSSNKDMAKLILFTMVKMIPFIFMGWSNLVSRHHMSKAMYLCPMTASERREYVNAILLFKMSTPVLLGVFLQLVWSVFFGFNIAQFFATLFIYFSMGVATYICVEGKDKRDQTISYATEDKSGNTRWAWMNIVLIVWCILLLVGLEYTDMTNSMSPTSAIFITLSLIAFFIFDILIFAKQYKKMLEQLSNYEITFHVLSKVKGRK